MFKKSKIAMAVGFAVSAQFAFAQGAEPVIIESAPVVVQETEPTTQIVTSEESELVVESAETTPASEPVPTEHSGIEEVVVTAQKRKQNLQDVPVAITAFTAENIEDQVIHNASDISMVTPNVQLVQSPNSSTSVTASIRGVAAINPSITWEPTVGLYVDGVFVAKNTGGLFDVADLERIEVLRGPQGTLYGKNTTGGAINLITRKPSEEFGGKLKVGAGNYNYTETGLSVDSGRLGDVVAINVSYVKRDRDGFYDNNSTQSSIDEFKKLDSEAGRVALAFDVADGFDIAYAYDWSNVHNTVPFGQLDSPVSPATGDFSLPKLEKKDEGAVNGAGEENTEVAGHALSLTYDINDDNQLKSITSLRTMKFDDATDADGTDLDEATVRAITGNPLAGGALAAGLYAHATRDVEYDQTSQEFQYLGSTDVLSYVVGAYYFEDSSEVANPFDAYILFNPGTPSDATQNKVYKSLLDYSQDSTSYALYSQLDWMTTDALTLTAGLRWTDETKEAETTRALEAAPGILIPSIGYTTKIKDSWSHVSPMIAANFSLNDDVSFYGRIADGWKSGGYNLEAGDKAGAEEEIKQETTIAYEIGMKAQWLDNKIQTNVAIFFNQIDDMQVSAWDSAAKSSVTANAGKAETSGIELEAMYLVTDSFTVFLNYGYLDAKYKEFIVPVANLAGDTDITDTAFFPYAPENTASLGLQYIENVGFAELRTRIDYAYVDEQDFYRDSIASGPMTHSEDYSVLNARLALVDIHIGTGLSLDVGIWGKNLTDEEYRQNGFPAFAGGINYYGDPATYGADLTLNF